MSIWVLLTSPDCDHIIYVSHIIWNLSDDWRLTTRHICIQFFWIGHYITRRDTEEYSIKFICANI